MMKSNTTGRQAGILLLIIGLTSLIGNSAFSQNTTNTLEIAEAAKTHIKNKTHQNGGNFPLKDIPQGRKLELDFNKIHKSKIGTVNKNEYFVCANFQGENGKNYDVDVFLKETGDGDYSASGKKPKVRKEDGDPRYTWEKEDDHYTQANKGIQAKKLHPDQEEVQSSQPSRSGGNQPGKKNNNRNNRRNNQGNERPGFNQENNQGNNQLPNNNSPNNNMPNNNRPGNQQPGGNTPGNNQPGGNMPGNNQPGGNTPGNNQPGGNMPGNNQPGGNTPGNNQPGGNTPGGNQPGGNTPGNNQPGGNMPNNNRGPN